jgi:chromosome segregation ATPase
VAALTSVLQAAYDEVALANNRLRAELDKAHRLLSQSIGWQRDAEIVKAKQAQEIEQLRAQWTESVVQRNNLQNAYDVLMARSKQMEADIERLQRRIRIQEKLLGEANIAVPDGNSD